MRVCLIARRPNHPLLAALPGLLGARHRVETVDPGGPTGPAAACPPADLYLLKAHSPQAVELARQAESRGGLVVNSGDATEFCQDRVQMAERAFRVGLPFPQTCHFSSLSELGAALARPSASEFPLIVKSRTSRRGDLVARLAGPADVRSLEARWGDEPVVTQDAVANDGRDYKVYVIGSRVFAKLCGSPLDGRAPTVTSALDVDRLPRGWLDLVRAVGESFDLQIYGVDILATVDGPMIVDINPFPGCRGIPGPPEALADFVIRTGAGTASAVSPTRIPSCAAPTPRDDGPAPGESTVEAVHHVVRKTFAALAGRAPDALRVASVRRKPGRGLTVGYRSAAEGRPSLGTQEALVTARIAEPDLRDPCAGKLIASVEPADFQGRWPGVLHCSRIGLTVQCFPHDAELPALAAAFGPTATALNCDLAAALTDGAREVLGFPGAEPAEVLVSPVRYKPGDRCVLQYRVRLTTQEELVFFGKLYRDAARAEAAYRLAGQLWAAWAAHERAGPGPHRGPTTVPAAVPRPLALLEELGLVITETAGGAHGGGQMPGNVLLRPPRRPRGGVVPPRTALAAAAGALAWLHTSGVPAEPRASSGRDCADRVRKWGQALCEAVHGADAELHGAVARLTDTLESLTRTGAEETVLAHGAFKPSQLVFCGPDHPVITDLDGAGPADPALDVGCFLAYLRPPGLSRGQGAARSWYATAREAFVDSYLAELASRGAAAPYLAGLRRRAALYDAALLVKIASRRVRRLNSPRPAEVRETACEIARCVERFREEGER
ncbi:phosphotransferase [Streptomyces sp. RB6PN25]|uniref:Phosphotransferase n=1 Tax=Streptomyces humicola TaxID=2953240 RepID=A0ABT1PSL4_9ACTN|nr:phosphotransferase [Streptomyces humicola]MCQ4079945.1 phosphotransferase [Streptomyces humicola]